MNGGLQMQRTRRAGGFTLVELLVGLMVTSIILSAVATLAFAMSTASTAGGDSASKEARIRQTTLYLSELISNCKLICANVSSATDKDLVLWRADDDNNGKINVSELVYIERGAAANMLQLCQFSPPPAANPVKTLAQLRLPTTKLQLRNLYSLKSTLLISDCNNVQFGFRDASPPKTGLLAITFGFVEDGVYQRYETVVAVRGRADYLLTTATPPEIVTGDDD
jgi:prepilin-type N-terminal cleavage/methylation domain-containing protein